MRRAHGCSSALVIAAALVPARDGAVCAERSGAWASCRERYATRWRLTNRHQPRPLPPMAEPGRPVADRNATRVRTRAAVARHRRPRRVACVSAPFRADVARFTLSREDAASPRGRGARRARRGASRRVARSAAIRLASDDGSQWTAHRFVWQEGGADDLPRVVGHTLPRRRCGRCAMRRSTATSSTAPRKVAGDRQRRRQHPPVDAPVAGRTPRCESFSRADAQQRAETELRIALRRRPVEPEGDRRQRPHAPRTHH